ncbi:translation initiation factor 2 [Viridibacillus arvi]|uniref:translation initiation factor 2 n=1 Tax=Viridibacillus arvi TaxID=263475 RepID=UPI003D07C956
MKGNNNSLGQDNGNDLSLQAAELLVLGVAITTIGESISTISAFLALEAERQKINNEKKDKEGNKNMQKQIDYLTTELEKLKYQVNKQKPRK